MVRIVKKLIKYSVLGLALLVVIGVSIVIVQTYRYSQLANKVAQQIEEEFQQLDLDNEVVELRYESPGKCSRSYKTGSIRCHTKQSRYYVTNDDTVSVFLRIDELMRNNGWEYWSTKENPITKDELQRVISLRLYPFDIYTKLDPYKLDAHFTFYGRESKPPHSDRLQRFIDLYKDSYPTLYVITIDGDDVLTKRIRLDDSRSNKRNNN